MPQAKVIDISSWQHPGGAGIDWGKVLESGVQGVIAKVTQGTGYLNPYGIADLQAAAAAGLLIGAYHFATPGASTAEAEAAHFLASIGGLPLELGAWLDMEDLTGIPTHEVGAWSQTWLQAVQAAGRTAGFYTDRSIDTELSGAPWGYRLWLAVPGASAPTAAGEWMTQTGQQDIDGIEGATDVDIIWNTRGVNLPPGATTPPPSAPPAPVPTAPVPNLGECTVIVPELKQGDNGWTVKACQLVLRGLVPNLAVDGDFGPLTDAAVREFQGKCPITQDGIVGPETWSFLMNGHG